MDIGGIKLGDTATLFSGETGMVTGIAHYTDEPTLYQIRYVNEAGCQTIEWWRGSAIRSVTREKEGGIGG